MARVRFFAAAEEAAGRDEQTRAETTVGSLRRALVTDFPGLTGILPRCAVLVGGSRVDDEVALDEGSVVDILPPFAGG